MIDPPHIWSVIYIRESNRSHPPTSPNIAPATQKWISWLIRLTYETLLTMRGASQVTLQIHKVLRLPRNSEFKIWARNCWIVSANIRTMKSSRNFALRLSPKMSRNAAPATKSHSPPSPCKYCPCHAKWILCLIHASPVKSHLQCGEQQDSPSNFPRYCARHAKMNLVIDPPDIWNVAYNASLGIFCLRIYSVSFFKLRNSKVSHI